jgi:hypothetical protein
VLRRWATLWLVVHLSLVLFVAARDTFDTFAKSETVFPASWNDVFRSLAARGFALIAGNVATPTKAQNAVQLYLNLAGIEAGYGFFAPNIPSNFKVVFELHHSDGRIDYDVPSVSSLAAGLRLGGLLDFLADTDSEELRAFMLKTLTEAAWREHPDVTSIDTFLGIGVLPSPDEFRRGVREEYKIMARYSFVFRKRNSAGRPDNE